MNDPYRHSDKAIKELYRLIDSSLQNFMSTLRFDELNIPGTDKKTVKLFEMLNREFRRQLIEVMKASYRDTIVELAGKNTKHEELPEKFDKKFLDSYDPVTQYVYSREWKRKRERMFESLVSVSVSESVIRRNQATRVLQRTGNLLKRQMAQAYDDATDKARMQAFADLGIMKVRWVTQKDEKVCDECNEREGMVFNLNNVPPKHYHCRCYLMAVS